MLRKIKRYKNRKLYDPMTRRYTDFNKVVEMVRSGVEIQVETVSSPAVDMTSYVLALAVAQEVKSGSRKEITEGLMALLRSTSAPKSPSVA